MKPLRTWVLIADGARAHILENSGAEHALALVDGMSFTSDHSATHELVDDALGRSGSAQGNVRSAGESRSDPHRNLKAKFAKQLSDVLALELSRGSFHRLIVVAPPATLGDLRSDMADAVKAVTAGELHLDLTKTPVHEVASHLGNLLTI